MRLEDIETIRERHEAARQALDDERYYSGRIPPVFPTNEGKRAHDDRATLLRLLDATREDVERLEGVLGLCADQFRVLGRLANGGQIHRIEEGGKRVRVSLSKVVSSECEISEARVRAALKRT